MKYLHNTYSALLLQVSIFLFCASAAAQTVDTLCMVQPQSRLIYYRDTDLAMQVARFDLPTPSSISEIRLTLGGDNPRGKARLRLFGNEGGFPVPLFEDDLCPPLEISKSGPGIEEIIVPLPNPIRLDNTQFFVAIDQLSTGTYLLSDSEEKEPACVSKENEYRYQYLKNRESIWRSGPYGYAISVSVEYDENLTGSFFEVVSAPVKDHPLISSNKSIAWSDVNNDSYPDLLVGGRLFINNGDETFSEESEEIGLPGSPLANVFIDANNDKQIDILFLQVEVNGERASHYLMVNDGTGNFTKKEIELPTIHNISSVSVADINQDGYLDLFLGQRVTTGDSQNYLFLNNKGSGFIDISDAFPSIAAIAQVTGSQWRDVDGNGFPDLSITSFLDGNTIWLRDDKGIAKESIRIQNNHPYSIASLGGDWTDYNNDGMVDLLLPGNVKPLYAQEFGATGISLYTLTEHRASNNRVTLNMADPRHIDYGYTRSGGSWSDVDNNGFVDFYVATSCRCNHGDLYIQTADGVFNRETADHGLQHRGSGPDVVWVDFNNDGKLDLSTFVEDEFRLYKNQSPNNNRYVEIQLESTSTNVQSIGSVVTVHVGENHYSREVVSGRGLLMQDPLVLHFGLGTADRIDSVSVRWPDGKGVETFTKIALNTLHRLKEGSSKNISSSIVSAEASPNPFNSSLTIKFTLPVKQQVAVNIYSLEGNLIKTIVDEIRERGSHTVIWDATDEHNNRVPQGIYVYRISSTNDGETSGRAVLVH